MKKIIRLTSAALLCCLLLLCPVTSANASDAGTIIYANDFSNGMDDTMSYTAAGSTEVVTILGETFLRCKPLTSGTRAFRMNFGPEEVKNVDITFKIRSTAAVNNTSAHYGVFFRSPAIPAFAPFSYNFRLSASKTALVRYDNYADTTQESIYEDAMIKANDCLWYNVKVCLRDNRMVVYLNGDKIVDCTDDYYPVRGGFGITSVRYTFDLDDLEILQYKSSKVEPTPNLAPEWVGEPGTDYKTDIPDSGKERLNLLNIGGNKDNASTAIDVLSLDELTLNKWIAIGLIVLPILLAVATLIMTLKLIALKKADKKQATEEATE